MNSWLSRFSRKEPTNPARWFMIDRHKIMPEPREDGSLKIYISQYDVPDAFRVYVLDEDAGSKTATAVIEFRYIELGEKTEKCRIDDKHEAEIGVHTKRAYKIFIKFDQSEIEHKVEFELVPDDISRVMDALESRVEAHSMQYKAAQNTLKEYKDNMESLLFPAV